MKKLLNTKNKKHNHEHDHALVIKNLTFGYTSKSKQLNNLNIIFHKNAWTTVLGPNGSGKSTLAKNIVRILKSKIGSIEFDGININNYKNKEYSKIVSYIPQMINIPTGISVYDYVSFGRNPWLGITSIIGEKDKEIIKNAMEKTSCWSWKDKMIDDLSGGQRQRVIVAMALAQTTDIIILDEPTTYLDIRAQYELLELMHEAHMDGKTIITILHDINQAVQYSDEIIVLKDGEIYSSGKPEEVVTKKMLKDVYGVETKLHKDGERKYITDVKLINFN